MASGEYIVKVRPKKENITDNLVFIGIIVGSAYWIIESIMHYFLFPGQGLVIHLFPDQPGLLTHRLLPFVIFILFGIFTQHMLSKRKHIEKALRETESRARTLVEALSDIVFILDKKGSFTYLNPETEKITGYKNKELIGSYFMDILSPECRDNTLEYFQKGISGGETPVYETEVIGKSGTIIRFELHVTTMYDDGGKIDCRIGVARDITKRKHVEMALRESEERFRILAESTPTAIMLYQGDKWIYANPAAETISGYTHTDLLNMNFWDIVHPDHRHIVKQRGESRQKGIPAERRYVFKIISKDGKEKWVDLSGASTILGGKPAGIISVVDITERKQSEEALRLSEGKYRNILENIEDSYFELDLAGDLVFFNDVLCQTIGYTKEELLGMNFRHYTTPAWQEYLINIFSNVFQTGNTIKQLEWEAHTKNGDIIYVEISASLKKDKSGKPIGFEGIARDITEKKRLEAQLHNAKKMESLGTLAGGIAHDFNNILMAIQGNSSLMYSDIDTTHPQNKRLKNIEQCVQSGAELTRQLLGFARGGKYEVKPTDINSLIEKTSEMFGHTRKEIAIHVTYKNNDCTVEVDQGQIKQVLLNLYVNAWQAMPAGGDLYITSEIVCLDEESVRPYHVPSGRYVTISVRDTGVGMDEDVRHRIFEPFFTTKEMGRGSGLGLASSYGIIQNHNGFIDVDSAKGKGSTFCIYLPASDKTIMEETIHDHDQILSGTETVLLIDDEEMIIEVGADIIRGLGYTVLTATSGKEALKIFKDHEKEIDLVILDMIMPEMSGRETFENLKKTRKDIKVILSSGYSLNDQASHILNRGCNGFIQKPFNIKVLSKKIRDILNAP